MSGAIWRFRVLAYLVGTGLIVLVLIGVPLQYAAGHPVVAEVVGPIHGVLYMAYLAASLDAVRRANWRLRRMVPIVLSGFLPFTAFVVERRVTPQLRSVESSAGR
jgi:integral membrane protein